MSFNSQDPGPGVGAGRPGGVCLVSRIPGLEAGGLSMCFDSHDPGLGAGGPSLVTSPSLSGDELDDPGHIAGGLA